MMLACRFLDIVFLELVRLGAKLIVFMRLSHAHHFNGFGIIRKQIIRFESQCGREVASIPASDHRVLSRQARIMRLGSRACSGEGNVLQAHAHPRIVPEMFSRD